MSKQSLKLIECPRDAMQGMENFISTELKVAYINKLLKCGFDTLDMGSFVSPRIIPQLSDTSEVLERIEGNTSTKLLTIVANRIGAEAAVKFPQINYLGYPFSISETFQKRNINKGMEASLLLLEEIYELAAKSSKEVVLYLSMGFGNPYGDPWSEELVHEWMAKLESTFSASIAAVSDTIGCAQPKQVENLFSNLISEYPSIEFGAHLHVLPSNVSDLSKAAYSGGCRRFDSVIKGFGGCPMAKDELTGNMPTELLIKWMNENRLVHGVDSRAFEDALNFSDVVFASNS